MAIKYAPYDGVDYVAQLKNAASSTNRTARAAALDKAKSMVTVQWTAPVAFSTWCSAKGTHYPTASIDGFTARSFRAGLTYTGIPYSRVDHSYDDAKFMSLILTADIGDLETEKNGMMTTAKGIDCSYFVFTALKASGAAVRYEKTKFMLHSKQYTETAKLTDYDNEYAVSQAVRPGDIAVKRGHCRLYVGYNSQSRKLCFFEATAKAGRCIYSEYTLSALIKDHYAFYQFTGFHD